MGLCLWALAWGGRERRYLASPSLASSASEVAFDCQGRTESKGPPAPPLQVSRGLRWQRPSGAGASSVGGSSVYEGEGWGQLPGEEEACPFRKGRYQCFTISGQSWNHTDLALNGEFWKLNMILQILLGLQGLSQPESWAPLPSCA